MKIVIIDTIVDCASVTVATTVVSDLVYQIPDILRSSSLNPFSFDAGVIKSDAFPCYSVTLWDELGTTPKTVTPETFITFDFTTAFTINLGPMVAGDIGTAAKN